MCIVPRTGMWNSVSGCCGSTDIMSRAIMPDCLWENGRQRRLRLLTARRRLLLPRVRFIAFVINYNMPQSLEEYYQEAGRAGRNGESARCILFYSSEDLRIGKALAQQQDKPERALQLLAVMWEYCQFDGCLRNYILRYFGETHMENCGKCSYCCASVWWKQFTDFFRNDRNYYKPFCRKNAFNRE